MNISYWIGKTLGFTSASMITLLGLVMALISIPLYVMGYDITATTLIIFSFLTDWWDGCVARFHQGDKPAMTRAEEQELSLWKRFNYKGVTHLGRALDPLVDKIRFLGLLWTIGVDHIDEDVRIGITVMAILLTLMRPVKRFLKLDSGAANRWGKIKVYSEVVLIALIIVLTRSIFDGSNQLLSIDTASMIINLNGYAALVFAVASFYTHIENGYTHYVCTRN